MIRTKRQFLAGVAVTLTCLAVMVVGGKLLQYANPEDLGADILYTDQASFDLWFIENTIDSTEWQIPRTVGAITDLPLGITAAANDPTEPIDSVEFQITDIPAFLVYDSVSSFPGFHVDVEPTVDLAGVTDLSVYITPEAFAETNNTPGAPTGSEIGELMAASAEFVRLQFRVDQEPIDGTYPINVNALLTIRNGDFSRFMADGNPTFPGENPGTIDIIPSDIAGSVLQIDYTNAVAANAVEIEFSADIMAGQGNSSAENPLNYYVYHCGPHVPAPDSGDSNVSDVNGCRQMNQGSLSDLGEPNAAERTIDDLRVARITMPNGVSFAPGGSYIVRVDNVTDAQNMSSVPAPGVYSQVFAWSSHPTVSNVYFTDETNLTINFDTALCSESGNNTADLGNYSIVPCNSSSQIPECTELNSTDIAQPAITGVSFANNDQVMISASGAVPGGIYVLRVQEVMGADCDINNAVPISPPYHSEMLTGYTPGSAVSIGFDSSIGFHLPWREKLVLKPGGGAPPFTWEVVPNNAGTFEAGTNNTVIFRPQLIDTNNQPIHDERDVILRVTDDNGQVSETPVHILRRGDLGGEPPLFLDKTDIQDVNDVASGWKR
jgi:hypothetical protein